MRLKDFEIIQWKSTTVFRLAEIWKILLFLLFSNTVYANFSISGLITDELQNPLNKVEILYTTYCHNLHQQYTRNLPDYRFGGRSI